MKFTIGVAFIALASLGAAAIAQTPPAAKPRAARMECKQEAVTGSFTRKVRQCRTVRAAAAKPAQPAPATAAVTTAPASTPPAPTLPSSTPSQPGDVDGSASETKGL